MAENPLAPPGSDRIGSLLMLTLFLLIFVIGPVYNTFLAPPNDDLHLVLADAKVTDVSETNRHFSYHLDGNELEEYNFRSFVAANPAARKGYNEDVGWDSSDLSHYLRLGDRLTKAANSPLLTVRRGDSVTHWLHYSAIPESKVAASKEAAGMADADSVRIP